MLAMILFLTEFSFLSAITCDCPGDSASSIYSETIVDDPLTKTMIFHLAQWNTSLHVCLYSSLKAAYTLFERCIWTPSIRKDRVKLFFRIVKESLRQKQLLIGLSSGTELWPKFAALLIFTAMGKLSLTACFISLLQSRSVLCLNI